MRISSTFNGSSAIWRFECSNVIEICEGLLHMYVMHTVTDTFYCVQTLERYMMIRGFGRPDYVSCRHETLDSKVYQLFDDCSSFHTGSEI